MAVRQHYNVTLAILTLAGTAFALQQTLVVPALPTFQSEFDASPSWTAWVLTVFLLTASVATPILGKLGDQFGKERLLVISLSIFLAGCLGASLAWNLASLIGFRALSGAGGAVFPLSFSIIRDEFPPEKVKVGIGLLSAVFGVGGGLGIVCSGLIIDHTSWRVLFLAGAIPVAVAIVLVHRFVPESPVKSPGRVDVIGALLLSAGLVAMLVALTEGEGWGWTSTRTLSLGGAAAALLVAWGLVELRVSEPMVDMRMLARRPVLLTNVTTLIAGFAMFGTFVLVPAFVEAPHDLPARLARLVDYGFGASATEAGLFLVPSSITMLIAGPVAGVLGRRYGSKWPLSAGMLLVALGSVVLAAWHVEPWEIVVAMMALGTGIAFSFAAMAALITESVRPTETGVATGMNTVMRTVGGVIGGQVGAALLTAQTIGSTSVPAESAFVSAFLLSAVAALIASGVAVFITPPWQARGRLAPAEALDPSR
jgi:EmrB/QacA subfamily drug resistance transporter